MNSQQTSSSNGSTSLFFLFILLFAVIAIQIANFTSLFHASKTVLFASENDYEISVSNDDNEGNSASAAGGGGGEQEDFLARMMNNNHDKNSNHNQKLPCYKIQQRNYNDNAGVKNKNNNPQHNQLIDNNKADEDTPSPLHSEVKDNNKNENSNHQKSSSSVPTELTNLLHRKTAIVVLTYNRPSFLERTIKSIQRSFLNEQLDGHKYISIDGDDSATTQLAQALSAKTSGGIQVIRHNHVEPPPESSGTFSLAAHYQFVFNEMFHKRDYQNVIIFEDDMDVGFDILTYFDALEPILFRDSTVWCISSWNDNAFVGPLSLSFQKVFRTSYFPGLGWMMKRSIWTDDLERKWPKDNWDHWMRVSSTHQQRSCIAPFVSRNFNFGNRGATANDDFYSKYLARIKSTGSEEEITTWGRAQKKEMIEKFYVRRHQSGSNRQSNNGAEEVMGFSSLSLVSDDLVIETEKSYEDWLQKSINDGELISSDQVARITHSSSYVASLAPSEKEIKALVVPYTSEQFDSLFSAALKIHPFPRTHYKFVTWFTVPTATLGVSRNVFLVDRRLSPFVPESKKISPDDSLEPVVARSTGISCSQACAEHRDPNSGGAVYKCGENQFDFINNCEVLGEFFPACLCQQGWGEDIPNMEATSIHHPPPPNCLVTEMKPTCEASHPLTTRLCPCVKA